MARTRDQSAELGRTLIGQLRWALSVTGITSRDKIVLTALILRASRFNLDCWPSLTTIASDTGLPFKSVSKSIGNLERAKYIEITRRNRNNYYILNVPYDCE